MFQPYEKKVKKNCLNKKDLTKKNNRLKTFATKKDKAKMFAQFSRPKLICSQTNFTNKLYTKKIFQLNNFRQKMSRPKNKCYKQTFFPP